MMKDLKSVEIGRQSDIERSVLFELRGRRDPEVVVKMAMDIAEDNPLGGLRILEKAIYSGLLEENQSEVEEESEGSIHQSQQYYPGQREEDSERTLAQTTHYRGYEYLD